ncbi:trypsin-like peptidase domain-containing protein [Streptomyces sp. enrichment culture]|uniref:S1C family serine protease n=1 Tax=Streptomyces sp. enrichment culture TaxID=1795815 RepID=UPI003F55A6CE
MPAPGAAVGARVPAPQAPGSATAPGTQVPAPATAPASGAAVGAMAPAPQAPGPATAPAPQMPAPAPAPASQAAAPATAPAPQAPAPAPRTPAPASQAPSGATPPTPRTPTPAPPTGPALPPPHGTPAPQGLEAAAAPLASVPPGPEGPATPGAAALPGPEGTSAPGAAAPPAPQGTATPGVAVPPAPEDGAGPWAGYDPWAAAQVREPLQQTGAKVLTRAQRRRRAWRWVVGWTLAVAVVSGGTGGVVGAYVERERLDGVRLPQPGSAPDSMAGIAARALPSVVTLHVRGDDEAGTGTGFVLDAQGHILTNNHVVEPAGPGGEISVTFGSGDTAKAEVVGRDAGYDLAVVRVRGVHGLAPLPLGDSDDVQVGDPVVAIGAPFDLAGTVTSGIISAKERPITAGGEKGDGSDLSYVDALQTDAPINPGNSGGPLLDSHARVIGINSAIRSAGGGTGADGGQSGSIGLGFAIPVNQAKRVAEELIDHGHATHPVIGVTLDMGYTGDGARIGDKGANGGPAVTRGGPGDRAGLRAGDVITEADGARVRTGRELIVKIRAHRPGDRLRLTVERDGTEREVSLVLGASGQN